jgi:hypothetical protein
MTRSCKWVFLGIVVFESVWFFYISQQRLIDGDEGFYLLAARLVLEHRAPYLDFFYTQAPLLPYVYAGWLKLFPISWAWARAFSALLTVIVGALVFEHVCHQTKRWMAGVAATVLYCSSALVFAWFPTAKTFSLSAIFQIEMGDRTGGLAVRPERGCSLLHHRDRSGFPMVDPCFRSSPAGSARGVVPGRSSCRSYSIVGIVRRVTRRIPIQ